MTIQYMLFAECNVEQLEDFVQHFEQLSLRLTSGFKSKFAITTDKNNCVSIWFAEISNQLNTLQGSVDATEVGFLLLKHLLNAPDFIFARVGVNVDNMLRNDFVADYKSDGKVCIPEGMVLHKSLWDELGQSRSNLLREFRPYYFWSPYFGQKVYVAWLKEFPHLQKIYEEFAKGQDQISSF